MDRKTLLAAAIAAAFAIPLAAQAEDSKVQSQADKKPSASTGAGISGPSAAKEDVHNPQSSTGSSSSSSSSSKPSSSTGSSASQGSSASDFKGLDKNSDGSLSRDEAKGWSHEKDFSSLDKNHDGKLSQDEYNAAQSSSSMGSGSDKAVEKPSASSGSSSSSSPKADEKPSASTGSSSPSSSKADEKPSASDKSSATTGSSSTMSGDKGGYAAEREQQRAEG